MVERLKAAVDKARAQRSGLSPAVSLQTDHADEKAEAPRRDVNSAWAALTSVALDERHLENNRILTGEKQSPATDAFDALRARILRVFQKSGMRRIGITSPTNGCGGTMVAANLALSMSQVENNRTILIDAHLRRPALGKVLGVRQTDPMRRFLLGEVSASAFLQAVSSGLAVGVTHERLRDPAKVILDKRVGDALTAMETAYDPDVIIYDLPPLLANDDAIGFLPHLDCVLLVTAGDMTGPNDILKCERLLADKTNLFGILLNKAEMP